MTIRDLIEQFTIQGDIEITTYDDNDEQVRQTHHLMSSKGIDLYEYEDTEDYLDLEILYMYSRNDVLVIEVRETDAELQ